MSGIKDYEYAYTLERRRQLQAALQNMLQERAALTQARLTEKRKQARERFGIAQANRTAATKAAIAQRARETQQAMQNATRRQADETRNEHYKVQEANVPEEAEIGAKLEIESKAADKLAEIEAWRETLADDDTVQTFQASEVQEWQERAARLLAEQAAAGTSGQDVLKRAEEMGVEAVAIHDEAGKQRGKFDARNELLGDIIASLKEIGFFVSDPSYQNSNNPSGPVVLHAVRGSEEMTAYVDLTETVKSFWNGLEEDHCKSAFCDYIEQMRDRGIEISAHRPEIAQRPVLLQKGACDLPQSTTGKVGQ